MKRNLSKLLARYLLTYLAVFLVPATILGALWYANAVNRLTSTIDSGYRQKAEAVASEIERVFDEFRTDAISMSMNPPLQPGTLLNHVWNTIEGLAEVRR